MGSERLPPLSAETSSDSLAADVRLVPLLATTAVLWAYILSTYVFKTWYVVTAIVGSVAALLAFSRTIRTSGLLRATVPVLLYFFVLFASAWWAEFPEETVWWVAVDSIGIAVFVLSYLAGLNASSHAITSAVMTLSIPALAIALIMSILSPTGTRSAQYGVSLLPFMMPFAYVRAVTGRSRWPVLLTITAAFAVLIIGRSRTHLGVAMLLLILAGLVFRPNLRTAMREALAGAALLVVAITVLVLVPITRKPVLTMFVRITHKDLDWGGLHIQAEGENIERVHLTKLSMEMLPSSLPMGIGYENFNRYFEQVYGYYYPLHNMYMTWALEGGVLCVGVVLVLAVRHVRTLRRFIRDATSDEDRMFARAIAVASPGILAIGAFHQVHQTPALWLLLGLPLGCVARLAAEESDDARETPLFRAWKRSRSPFAPVLCEPLMAAALKHLSACEPGALIADVGCGTGFMLPVFRTAGYRAIGIDADPSLSAPITADAEHLPLQSGSVDGLFAFSAFQYTDRERVLEECRRVLKSGGRFAIIENLEGNPVAKLSRLARRLRGSRYSRYLEPRGHLHWSGRAIYERFFTEVSYELHHVVSPLFLFSEAIAAPEPRMSLTHRVTRAAFRVVQRTEQRVLAGGWLRAAAWHVVLIGRK